MIQKPKGTRDFLPEAAQKTRQVEDTCIHTARHYGFEEIRFPMFEKTELFERGVGETTDVVKKEMFRVISAANLQKYLEGQFDMKKEGLTLRPEGTASVVRSFIENKIYAQSQPTKLFYLGPNFRNERPQAGRYREFTQFGVEVFGSNDPYTDAEVIALADEVIKKNGLRDVELSINSIGCKKDRPVYEQALRDFLKDKVPYLCTDCQERYEKNPMRIIDCKVPEDQERIKGYPVMLDYLCEDCQDHFDGVQKNLQALQVPFKIDPAIVRGLDYYVMTAFEFQGTRLGSQSTICGGGRYDGLVEQLGGPAVAGIGFGMGIDRLVIEKEAARTEDVLPQRQGSYLLPLGAEQRIPAAGLMKCLREKGLRVEMEVTGRSLKAGFKHADKKLYRFLLALGENEVKEGKVLLKDLKTADQQLLDEAALIKYLGEINE